MTVNPGHLMILVDGSNKAKALQKCLKSIQIPLMIIGYINRVQKGGTSNR